MTDKLPAAIYEKLMRCEAMAIVQRERTGIQPLREFGTRLTREDWWILVSGKSGSPAYFNSLNT